MNPVTVEEAVATLLAASIPQPSLRLPLRAAAGHVLAEEIVARWPLPQWTASSMDGFAVRGDDVRGASRDAPCHLPVVGGAGAGGAPPPPLPRGGSWRVATGGRIPEGADTVIRQEDTDQGETVVAIHDDRDIGRHLRPVGGDLPAGAVAVGPGTMIGPGQVALLAALGITEPMVIRRPRIATLSSGDEIASLDHVEAIAAGRRLADANGPMLEALVNEAGGVVAPIGLLPDDREAIAAAVRASGADLIISAGAVSVGSHDHIPGAMADLGAALLFRRVRLRPGGPCTAARLPDGRLWLALPGNPVSALVTFHLFARPVIRAMAGDPRPVPARRSVTLAVPTARDPRLDLYLRVRVSDGPEGCPSAQLTGGQGSWLLSSIAAADGVVQVAAGEGMTGAEPLPFLSF